MPKPQKNKGLSKTPPQRKTNAKKRLYFLIGDDLSECFVGKDAKWSDQASRLIEELTEKAFKSSVLRAELREFYLEHTDFFDNEKPTIRINLEVAELTIAFANSLSFDILRHGNISALLRLLTRYQAVREGLLREPKRSRPASVDAKRAELGERTKTKLEATLPSAPQEKYKTPVNIRSIYSVSRTTSADVSRLAQHLQSKKMAVVRDLIERAARKEELEKIIEYYNQNADDFEVSGSNAVPFRLNVQPEIDALHFFVAMRMFNSGRKKSKVLRVLVAYYTDKVFKLHEK